jgi:hypothetical protein
MTIFWTALVVRGEVTLLPVQCTFKMVGFFVVRYIVARLSAMEAATPSVGMQAFVQPP